MDWRSPQVPPLLGAPGVQSAPTSGRALGPDAAVPGVPQRYPDEATRPSLLRLRRVAGRPRAARHRVRDELVDPGAPAGRRLLRPARPQNEALLYRVPVHLESYFPGVAAPGSGGGSPTGGGAGTERRGASGPDQAALPAAAAPAPTPRSPSMSSRPSRPSSDRRSTSRRTAACTARGQRHGRRRGARHRHRQRRPGGDGDGPGGLGVLAAREPRPKPRPRAPAVREDDGSDAIEEAFGSDDVQVVGAPAGGPALPRLDGLRRLPAHLRELPRLARGLLAARPDHQRRAGRGVRDRAGGRQRRGGPAERRRRHRRLPGQGHPLLALPPPAGVRIARGRSATPSASSTRKSCASTVAGDGEYRQRHGRASLGEPGGLGLQRGGVPARTCWRPSTRWCRRWPARGLEVEMIVVDDGSTDRSAALLREATAGRP